ncbi:hypothetical protein BDBG_17771 [Blastomyces gilchristii SLH14081]|uniref:Uncharacterized protein n=1 Tax=Blastomyces gilchristii (strain SLH14081) TaxID=559298 RepID=A0A179UZM7_BLAGS|nr:uncharacterized protein BDBG_17771 [Blastomyces gilchristii SLH14081]OAT13283.1 hypothetical protein BDBG_17771 [Blastomyces gilchristii SLH14081]
MLGYAKDKKVSDFINLDKPDIFSELEEPLEPESPEEATAEAKIVYDIKVTAWKIKYMKYEKLNEDDIKEADIAGQFNLKKDFLNANLAIDADYAQAWAKNVQHDKDVISLIELVKNFKERYREMGILKEDKPMNFATLNERPQQSSPATFRNCICGACH